MKKWLEEAVDKLLEVREPQHRVVSATCIACCVVVCQISYSLKIKDFVVPLLQMLKLDPTDIKEKVSYLRDITSPDFQ